MSASVLVKGVADSMRSLALAAESIGQERVMLAVRDQLKSRGADDLELAVFEKAVRERLEYSGEDFKPEGN